MSSIKLKMVEYPEEKIIELEDLTETGITEVIYQAKQLIEKLEQKSHFDMGIDLVKEYVNKKKKAGLTWKKSGVVG